MRSWSVVVGVALLGAGCSFRASNASDGDGDGADDGVGPRDAMTTTVIDAAPPPPPIDAAPAIDAAPPDPPGLMRAVPTATGANPSPDGDDVEYAAAPRYAVVLDPAAGNYAHVAGYQPSMAASVRAVYTAEYLGFFVEVTDSQVIDNSSDAYLDDAVTLYVDADGNNDGPWHVPDREVIVDFGETVEVYNDDQGDFAPPTIGRKATRTATGFTLELRLKRSAFVPMGAMSVGFNLGLFDDDGLPHDLYFPNAYGLWFEGPEPRCASCCTAWDRSEAWCDTTFNGTLTLSP